MLVGIWILAHLLPIYVHIITKNWRGSCSEEGIIRIFALFVSPKTETLVGLIAKADCR